MVKNYCFLTCWTIVRRHNEDSRGQFLSFIVRDIGMGTFVIRPHACHWPSLFMPLSKAIAHIPPENSSKYTPMIQLALGVSCEGVCMLDRGLSSIDGYRFYSSSRAAHTHKSTHTPPQDNSFPSLVPRPKYHTSPTPCSPLPK